MHRCVVSNNRMVISSHDALAFLGFFVEIIVTFWGIFVPDFDSYLHIHEFSFNFDPEYKERFSMIRDFERSNWLSL